MAEPISTALAIGISANLAADAAEWLLSEARDSDLAREIERQIGKEEAHPKAKEVFSRAIQDASRNLPHLDDSTVEVFFDDPANHEIVSRWVWNPERAESEIADLDLSSAGSDQEYANLRHFVERLPEALRENGQVVFSDDAWLVIWRVTGMYEELRREIDQIEPSTDPAPLSPVPAEKRLFDQPLIGREQALNWLRDTDGDRLLVGQPGSGKTFLLYHLTGAGGLFAVSKERGELARALRNQTPTSVIVDDASSKEDLLRDLAHLREEVGVEFDIVASCWPGSVPDLKQSLHLGDSHIRELDPLTRDEVVEVVRGAGLEGPRPLIRHIVDQASGRPGLAVTLTHLCLEGNVREVVLGDHIAESVLSTFEPIAGEYTKQLLGVFAMGGKKGLPLQSATNILGIPVAKVRRMLEQLAAGGVINEIRVFGRDEIQRPVAVQPSVLRHALIRDVFFEGPAPPPFEEPFDEAVSVSSATQALIGAHGRGASVSTDFLRERIEELDQRDLWRSYASVGPDEARWILSKHPERAVTVAEQGLSHAPRDAIPVLLKQSVGDKRPLPQTPNHPLRKVKDWVLAGHPGTEEAVQRRRTLFEVAQKWVEGGGDRLTGLKAMRYAVAPQYKHSAADPGSGYSLTLEYGTLLEDGIESIQPLWDMLWEELNEERLEEWPPILDLLHDWWAPQIHWQTIHDDLMEKIHEQAERQVEIAVERASSHPGILRRLSRKATAAGVDVDTSEFEAFEVLYPKQNPDEPRDYRKRHIDEVGEVADKWSERPPEQVAQDIQRIWRQSEIAGLHLKSARSLCQALAKRVASPLAWQRAFRKADLPSSLTRPFLKQAERTEKDDWKTEARRQIEETPERCGPALQAVLRNSDTGSDLHQLALQHLDNYLGIVETLTVRDQLDIPTIRALLAHDSKQVANAAAEALFHSELLDSSPLESIPEPLYDQWRDVVIHKVRDAAWLERALQEDSELAYEWSEARITAGDPFLLLNLSVHDLEEAAVGAMTLEERRELLDEICSLDEDIRPKGFRWARLLVGNDLNLYQHLIDRDVEEVLTLGPLIGRPDEAWLEKAEIALDAGHAPEDIAEAAFGVEFSWTGSESEMWKEWTEAFQTLDTDNRRLQEALGNGADIAEKKAERAAERERQEKI